MDDHIDGGIDEGGPGHEIEEAELRSTAAAVYIRDNWRATSASKKRE